MYFTLCKNERTAQVGYSFLPPKPSVFCFRKPRGTKLTVVSVLIWIRKLVPRFDPIRSVFKRHRNRVFDSRRPVVPCPLPVHDPSRRRASKECSLCVAFQVTWIFFWNDRGEVQRVSRGISERQREIAREEGGVGLKIEVVPRQSIFRNSPRILFILRETDEVSDTFGNVV